MFHRQFVLGLEPPVPFGWITRHFGNLMLHTAPDLPIVELTCSRGRGLLLGWPIYKGRLFTEGESLQYDEEESAPRFDELCGRFVVLLAEPGGSKCYLDPGGYLPLVYCPQQRVLASTTGLIPPSDHTGDDLELTTAFDIPAKDNWYPFGLTGRKNVRRLLPNHALDLNSFHVSRYWPTGAFPDGLEHERISGVVGQIAALLQRNIGALASQGELTSHLTAGRDSRIMLAASRPYIDKMRFVTFRLPDQTAKDDCRIARRIASRLGLAHQVIDYVPPVAADVDAWLRDTGGCVAGRTSLLATTWKSIPAATKFSLTGHGGELGRAVDWQDADAHRDAISTRELLARLGLRILPMPSAVAEAGEKWRATLEPIPSSALLDFGMMELWIPSCAAPSFYGHCHADISISPFGHRKLIELMLSLPVQYRADQQLTTDLLNLMWPELNDFPFNPTSERLRARWLREMKLAARQEAARAREHRNRSAVTDTVHQEPQS